MCEDKSKQYKLVNWVSLLEQLGSIADACVKPRVLIVLDDIIPWKYIIEGCINHWIYENGGAILVCHTSDLGSVSVQNFNPVAIIVTGTHLGRTEAFDIDYNAIFNNPILHSATVGVELIARETITPPELQFIDYADMLKPYVTKSDHKKITLLWQKLIAIAKSSDINIITTRATPIPTPDQPKEN